MDFEVPTGTKSAGTDRARERPRILMNPLVNGEVMTGVKGLETDLTGGVSFRSDGTGFYFGFDIRLLFLFLPRVGIVFGSAPVPFLMLV